MVRKSSDNSVQTSQEGVATWYQVVGKASEGSSGLRPEETSHGKVFRKIIPPVGIASTKAVSQGQVWLSAKEGWPGTRSYKLFNLGCTHLPGKLPEILMTWPTPREPEEISLRFGLGKRNFKRDDCSSPKRDDVACTTVVAVEMPLSFSRCSLHTTHLWPQEARTSLAWINQRQDAYLQMAWEGFNTRHISVLLGVPLKLLPDVAQGRSGRLA